MSSRSNEEKFHDLERVAERAASRAVMDATRRTAELSASVRAIAASVRFGLAVAVAALIASAVTLWRAPGPGEQPSPAGSAEPDYEKLAQERAELKKEVQALRSQVKTLQGRLSRVEQWLRTAPPRDRQLQKDPGKGAD